MPTSTLLLGTAKALINPPADTTRLLYPRPVPYTGVEADLFTRVAVFGAADAAAPASALVVIDTLYVHAAFVAAVRGRVAASVPGLPAAAIMVVATHTHSAPTLIDIGLVPGWNGRQVLERGGRTHSGIGPVDPEYLEGVIAGSAAAAAAAWAGRRPVLLRVGLAESRLCHNRRVVDAEGRATNVWQDPEGRHTGYFSPAVRFAVFEDAQSARIHAVISGWGCHPVAVGPGAVQPSPDYPGHFSRCLEAATGAADVIHITTGGANINPRICLTDTPEVARALGRSLAETVLAAIPGARPVEALPLGAAQVPMELTTRTDVLPARGSHAIPGQVVRTEVQALRLGDLAFVSAPGELFAELTTSVENTSPFANTFVCGHANDAVGYLPTDSAVREGGYEAARGAVVERPERAFLAAARQVLDATLAAPLRQP